MSLPQAPLAIERAQITGLVLAGGRGSRMGGQDKGLQPYRGVPLALHALHRVQPQVGRAIINANRNLPTYASFGVPVHPDARDGTLAYDGPLAGFLAGLEHCTSPLLLTVPCDAPHFPTDLARHLASALTDTRVDLAYACTFEDGRTQPQPVFCLLRNTLRDSLAAFLQGGGRQIVAWFAQHRAVAVRFDDASAFFNVNTPAALAQLQNPS